MKDEWIIPERWMRRMERFSAWYLAILFISFPILKVGLYVWLHPTDQPHSLKVRQVLAVYHWVANWF